MKGDGYSRKIGGDPARREASCSILSESGDVSWKIDEFYCEGGSVTFLSSLKI